MAVESRSASHRPSPWQQDWSHAAHVLRGAGRILLTSHVNPDGDGLGSMLALAEGLKREGLDIRCALHGSLPDVYRFLFEDSGIQALDERAREELLAWRPDLLVILDVSALSRTGWVEGLANELELPLLILDHHLSNELEGDGVYCFPGLSSTGEVVGALLEAMGMELSPSMAQALYTSLTTDTGGFAFASTGPETLELAARLLRRGARPERIHAEVYQNYPLSRFDLLRLFLGSREEYAGGRLQVFRLTEDMYTQAGASRDEAEGFANMVLGIRGCQMSMILGDREEGGTKVNLRCQEPWDVCAIARELGGGGHRYASGATVMAPLAEVHTKAVALALTQFQASGGAE
jgi:phosphoesterase RecJ-like protein